MPPTQELAGPLLYLQRHTFELLVKEVLRGLLEIREQMHALDELLGEDGPGPADQSDIDKAYSTHKLDDLLSRLISNLRALKLPSLPAEFEEAKRLFFGVDKDEPDRLRYDVQFKGKPKTIVRSFPRKGSLVPTTRAPCNDVATLLSAIMGARTRQFENHLKGREVAEASALDLFYDRYMDACRYSEYEIECRLKEFVCATKSADISWRELRLAPSEIARHRVLEGRAEYFDEDFLESEYAGRRLILGVSNKIVPRGMVMLDDYFYLATQRADGSFSQGVWFCGYQSELAREVFGALKGTSEDNREKGSP
jgi:hypothetical protein